MRTIALLPILVLALFSCNRSKKVVPEPQVVSTEPGPASDQPLLGGPTKADSLFFSIERRPCFGTCKAYRIEVYRSGFATYNGRKHMEKEGPHTAWIDKGTMSDLLAAVEQSGFFTMEDKYDAEVTDLPSTIIHVVATGKDKKVIGRVGQPQAFKTLVTKVEELLLPLPWKPVRSEP